jgi:Ca-activated chloride channel family protein
LSLSAEGLTVDALAPARLPDLFPGVPYVVAGRYKGAAEGTLTLRGTTRDGRPWSASATAQPLDSPATRYTWARAYLRDLEDKYVTGGHGDLSDLEAHITETSLRFGVLCRFTAFVAVDARVVNEGGKQRRVVQPVEAPSGWAMFETESAKSVALGITAAGPVAMPMSASPIAPPPPMQAPPMSAPPMPGSPAPRPTSPPMPIYAKQALGDSGGGMMRLPRGRGRQGIRPQAPAAEIATVAPAPDYTSLMAQELQRLRDAADRPAFERRELLEDLGSRLAALGVKELNGLAEQLQPEAIAKVPFEELWDHVLRTLAAVAAGAPAPKPERRSFWKR